MHQKEIAYDVNCGWQGRHAPTRIVVSEDANH
jgi:hypothetical protein